jgi:hypothetical protein
MPRKKKNAEIEVAKNEIGAYLKEYPNVELSQVVEGEDGKRHYFFRPTHLAYKKGGAMVDVPPEFRNKHRGREVADVTYKDWLLRSDVWLAKPDVANAPPHDIYKRIRQYHRSKDVFGSYIDLLCDLSISGFENDCEDMDIKEFFDNWCQDVDMEEVLEWVFHEFFRSGMVRTYKILGPYTPRVNRLRRVKKPPSPKIPKKTEGESEIEYQAHKKLWEYGEILPKQESEDIKEYAARKKRWSKGFIPIAYTVLNPTEIELVGPPAFNQTRVKLKISPELADLVKRTDVEGSLTPGEKEIVDNIPPEIKAAMKNGNEVELDPDYVGAVDNRKMPYEKYAINPMARALESVEYKVNLREADYSTLNNITSEILIVTVGDKDFPVTRAEELEAVADLFNTVQKSYQVFWNHTLKVERLPVENIEQIFGAKKFEQAETDISGAMRVPRALLDGVVIGNTDKEALQMSLKSLTALINYARRQVARWLYREYDLIADAYGFDRYPSVRWDTFVLKDELAIKTLIEGLVDRRIISYQTAIKWLGFDPDYEKRMLKQEAPEVEDGHFGVIGSPYNQKGDGDGGGSNVQKTQRTPKGTPSEGRPSGKPSPKKPKPSTPEGRIKETVNKEIKNIKKETKQAASFGSWEDMTLDEIEQVQHLLSTIKQQKKQDLWSAMLDNDDE